MKRVALIWDSPLLFARLLSDCGYQCDQVTPHLLAAPFFRGEFSLIVIPGGFGDSKYSCVLPALKALSSRFKRYISEGGVLLLFGAVSDNQDVYQWLVPGINYHFGFFDAEIVPTFTESDTSCESSLSCALPLLPVEYSCDQKSNANVYSLDGYFTYDKGTVSYPVQILATAVHPETHEKVPVFVRIQIGNGVVFICTIHEYPSTTFLMQATDTANNTQF